MGIQTAMAQGRSTKVISMLEWIRTRRLSIKKSLSSARRHTGVCRTRCRVHAGGKSSGPSTWLFQGQLLRLWLAPPFGRVQGVHPRVDAKQSQK